MSVLKEKTFDGHSAARQMTDKGAAVVIVERDLGLENQIIVSDTRSVYPEALCCMVRESEKELKLYRGYGDKRKDHYHNCAEKGSY